MNSKFICLIISASLLLASCHDEEEETEDGGNAGPPSLDSRLEDAINDAGFGNLAAYRLPDGTNENDYDEIPADANNAITADKVELGRNLFHETAIATEGATNRDETWSCATCHHYQAGFKSGIAQAIGEGGEGFGVAGESRVLASGFNADSTNPSRVPDVSFRTAPSLLNVAYQPVMFWDGQFGGAANSVNSDISPDIRQPQNTPLAFNSLGFSGLETRAIAGWGMHGMRVTDNSVLQSDAEYRRLFNRAFPNSSNISQDAGLAVAAYLRTLLPYEAPFQRWLRGDRGEMRDTEKRGAILFFDKAGCVDCHNGPALSSQVGAAENNIFYAIGFDDFNNNTISGEVDDTTKLGRGGFTGISSDNYKFKIPQLYNLADTNVFGHGGSFSSIRAVVDYKNAANRQNSAARNIAREFRDLNLTATEIDDLVAFLETGLYDASLVRYVPSNMLPSEQCFPNNDETSQRDLGC